MSQEQDILRILIATDNHLGVWESDEVRKDDSFTTFNEIFEIAAQQNADMVLLGGDLFHDNKPSRQTIVKAMDIFNKHCLHDRPITFQVISDQKQNFTTGRVNFENPNYNVGLPVFTIHGNHDDPAGTDNLSAVDILATSNLVNYFGKAAITGEGTGKVRIAPVLLQKGETKLALYGLGNIRDERLCRLFSTPNSVEWVRPASSADAAVEEWFNVFVLHQNRVAHTQAAKNCVREGHLARFIDLVVWGHEHECLADPWESLEAGGQFSVMQPGSSVATALSEGESKRKHVVLLEILGQNWRTVKFPLETVRPFVFDSVTLAGREELDPEQPETVSAFLADKVNAMIEQATRARGPKTPELPLVRLRVDYTGFSTINTQRFGQKFVNKVANPQDIILWQKAAVRKTKAQREAAAAAVAAGVAAMNQGGTLDETRIEDLISAHLQQNLEILPEAELTGALRDYVDKDEKDALQETVAVALEETQVAAQETGQMATAAHGTLTEKQEDKELSKAIEVAAQKRKAEATAAAIKRRAEEERAKAAEAAAAQAAGGAAGAGPSTAVHPTPTPATQKDAFDEDSDDAMPAPPPRPGRGRGRGRGAAAASTRAAVGTTANTRKRRAGGATPAATPSATPSSARPRGSRSAAAAAKQRLSTYRDDRNGDRSGDEDYADLMDEDEVIETSESDDDGMDEDDVEVVRSSAAARSRPAVKRGGGGGRRGGTQARNFQGLGTAEAPISLIDSDEDEERIPNTASTANGRAGGRNTQQGRATQGGGGRSQLTFGRVGGTSSQQVSRWGTLK